jgi:hypothetical protein
LIDARERTRNGALFALLALASLISVWTLLSSGTIPAFQQDWTWPISRQASYEWLQSFFGLWDPRSLGHSNALPWQTYAVVLQVAIVAIFGPSLGLAVWIAALEFGAALACVAMLAEFGVWSRPARLVAALFYALSPVVYTRVAAGHLAYVLAYALLPLIVVFAKRSIENRAWTPCVMLGVTIGFAGSQIQFLGIAWLAVLPLAIFVARARAWALRLLVAAGIAVALQLQSLLPLLFSSTQSLYVTQRALLSWEYNNSSPAASAPIMLGYFTQYYELHALPWAFAVLYALLGAALLLGILASRRAGAYALVIAAIGATLTAGLYGPLSAPLAWIFDRTFYATAFRDFHYFAALTAIGIALGLGLGLQRVRYAAAPCALLVVWIVAPAATGSEFSALLVPPHYVADAVTDMHAIEAHGAGRVLWLPVEEPLSLSGAGNLGRDFVAYGRSSNPAVADDFQNPQLAYAIATLRDGKPDWNAFRAMSVRFLVFRNFVRSRREEDSLGTGFQLAYGRLNDAGLGASLGRDPQLRLLMRTAESSVYELAPGDARALRSATGAMLYSELAPDEVSMGPDALPSIGAVPSSQTANPRLAWVEGRIGWRYRPWLPDSIYPFVWTVTKQPLVLSRLADASCLLVGSAPTPSDLQSGTMRYSIAGTWRRYQIGGFASGTLYPGGGVTAIVDRPCPPMIPNDAARPAVFVMASGYDAGWRAIESGRLVAPRLANGWMMAWDASAAQARLVYVPAYAQLIGFLIGVVVLAAASTIGRSLDRQP